MKNYLTNQIDKYAFLSLVFICFSLKINAQDRSKINIEMCDTWAMQNYPLVKQLELIEKTKDYSVTNAARGYMPQLNIGGQATYQSDVTQIPIKLPNVDVPTLSKDQYKIYGEINQPLTDLATMDAQKEIIKNKAETDKQKIEVEMYQIKERVNQVYFGILLIDAQIKQTDLLKNDIQTGIEKANAAVANGISLKSEADILKAEMLKVKQSMIELLANKNGFLQMLSLLTNQKIDENTELEIPQNPVFTDVINRPELRLFESQKKVFDFQSQLINARQLPRFSLFLQSGYGKPALNLLKNDFDFYYIGGLRLNWNISGFYTSKKEKKILTMNAKSIDIQKETFLFNTKINMTQQSSNISKLQELMQTDNEIIQLRENIKNTSNIQLENGTITSYNYLVNVNALDRAKQNLLLHRIQLLQTQYQYKTTTGN